MLKKAVASCVTRTIVLADLHLIRETPEAVTADLARLIAAHPGARIIFAGDLFDLSSTMPRRPKDEAVVEALEAHPDARAALGRHVESGGELWLLGGNHDAEVGTTAFHDALLDVLRVASSGRARVRNSPWFIREGGLHLEHGHFYDPDNAPAHPLVIGATSLGVHFVEEFIAPTGAHRYLQENDQTPLRLFLSSFTWYGPRAPHVIYRYFRAALGALLKSGPLYRAGDESHAGQRRIEAFAEEIGLSKELLEEVRALGATPTLESLSRTFTRMYLDRVLATLAMTSGAAALGLGARRSGGALVTLGALLMGTSWSLGYNRYAGAVAERLAESAHKVREVTGAELVVFGHTHREGEGAGYANTGSFAFPGRAPGRPYLEIEGPPERPRAVRRYLVGEPRS
jgi:UDP-2,3-diacylglucosamine pyrophosphatase LpxH